MGAKQSSIAELADNPFLLRFVKDARIERENKFWEDFVSFAFLTPVTKSDCRLLKETIEKLCAQLAKNNLATGNFTTLVCLCVFYIRELITDETKLVGSNVCHKCHNSLLILRCCVEHFIENLTEDELASQFNTLPSFDGHPTVLEECLLVLSEVIAYIPVNDATYGMHLEAITLLLVLLSMQMLDNKTSNKVQLMILNSKCSKNATFVVRTLLHNYIKNDYPPSREQGIVGWAASGIWSMFGGSPKKCDATSTNSLNPLASHSLLLLLVLSFHYTKDKNSYRDALFQCKPGKRSEGEDADKDRSFPLNFKRLYNALAKDLENDQSVLLLYLLLHKNPSFLKYILKQKDLEKLVIPILQVLYDAEHKNAHHIYMALIVILIFTQEDQFNKLVHDMLVTDVTWYKDKTLTGISLGSLIVLIVLRTIQYNMAKMRDKYLHTNCLASLANMSSNFKYLHSFVTQKFITLFQQLIKRHTKYIENMKTDDKKSQPAPVDELADLAVLEEVIHMMIEILNACLCANIEDNSNLVFALLRSKELFEPFRTNPRFQDVIQNIDSVLSYFGSHVEEVVESEITAEQILLVIKEASVNWPKEQTKKFAELKFRYMEEEAAEEFFVPYVWSIVYKSSYIYWNSKKISLFHINPT